MKRIRHDLSEYGLTDDTAMLAGNFEQFDQKPGIAVANEAGVEVLPLSIAQRMGLPLMKRLGSLLDAGDEIARQVCSRPSDGYLIHVQAHKLVQRPIQTCLYATENQVEQIIQNLIVVEAGAQAQILAGCLAADCADGNKHLSVTEIFVDDDAELNLTMVHDWRPTSQVFPRTFIRLGQRAKLTYNYVCLQAPAILESDPIITLDGDKSRLRSESILLASSITDAKLGSRVLLNGQETQADLRTQVVASGGRVVSSGRLEANSSSARGHLACDGLLLTDASQITAVPELQVNQAGAELSHEASIGQIAKNQIEYLQARGFSVDQATGLIVSGLVSLADNPLLTQRIKQRLATYNFN